MSRFAAALVWLLAGSCSDPETIDRLTVRVLYGTDGPGDGSVNDSVNAGVVVARSGATFELEELVPETGAEALATLDEWIEVSGPRDLIVVGSAGYAEAIEARECDFGETNILLVDASVSTCEGLRSVSFQSFAPAYLAGVAAIADPTLAPTGRVGMIGGTEIPPVRELLDGFRAGVEATGGEVVAEHMVGDDPESGFTDIEAAAALAEELVDEVDVLFVAAGRASQGVGNLLEERVRRRGVEHVWLVGVDTDQSVQYGQVTVGSVLKRFDAVVRDAILEMVAGDLTSGDVVVGFRDRYTELLLHPRRAVRVLEGDCDECDAFLPSCYRRCTTLDQRVRMAEDAAATAAAEWRAR
ncbi:MAG: BMP family ABC transporter substrate-binding protein [Deltaproteobacteria bacterium]|nr:BMP family ABC transporter substrate-binding protein [Deltaproteobacteria bacterium]